MKKRNPKRSQAVDIGTRYRLITQSDFDGLICAVLLKYLNRLEEIKFAHPKDMLDGKVEVTDSDITTSLPYVEGVHLCFDQPDSVPIEADKDNLKDNLRDNHIVDPSAPSSARAVFNYFGGFKVFPREWADMLDAVDRTDTAQFTREEITNPSGWNMLNFIVDPRTGLGRYRVFRISNYELMMKLIDYCSEMSIDEIIQTADVQERIRLYDSHSILFKDQILRNSTLRKNVVVLDLRNEEEIFVGNRFMLQTMFPNAEVSIHVLWGLNKQNTIFAIGRSIINQGFKGDIGEVCRRFDGYGTEKTGLCQVSNKEADKVLESLLKALSADK